MDWFQALQGIFRHGLTTLGGWLVANGWLAEGETQALVGGGMVIIGVVWSIFTKKKTEA